MYVCKYFTSNMFQSNWNKCKSRNLSGLVIVGLFTSIRAFSVPFKSHVDHLQPTWFTTSSSTCHDVSPRAAVVVCCLELLAQ